MAKVFISSTGKDLTEYREAATAVCLELGLFPIAMEFFAAVGKGATAGSKSKLDDADVYVGIFAHRYGYIEDGYDKSVTEIEFDYAGEKRLDRLCFLLDPKHPWAQDTVDYKNHERLEKFRKRINKLIRSQFTTVDNFRASLMQALVEWKKQAGVEGSTGQDKVPGDLPEIFNIPHQRNPNFTGRGELLRQLREALGGGGSAAITQAIHGLGGVGKTQLALEYAYRFAGAYSLIWWVRSEGPESLNADFEALGNKLGVVGGEGRSEQSEVAEAVRAELEHRTGWLLVFDNARNPGEIKPCLPRGSAGHVIVTSRYSSWGGVAKPLPVKVWEPDESLRFLLARTGQTSETAARELAEELGRLPLALDQAAAYIERAGQTLAGYLELFRRRKLELFQAGVPGSDENATVTTTWEISFQEIAEEHPAAAGLMNLCAFLAPDDIPVRIIVDGAEHLPEELAAAVQDPLELDKAVMALRDYSLVELGGETPEERGLSMHRLVQAVTRERLSEEDQKTWLEAAAKVVNKAFPFDSDDVRYWPLCGSLSKHAAQAASHAETLKSALEAAGRLLNQLGLYMQGRADLDQAKRYYERALAIGETVHGPEHPTVAIRVNNIGAILKDQGDLAGALEYTKRALAIDEKVYGPEHPNVAIRASNIGTILKDQGDLAGALEYAKRALVIQEKVYGAEHATVAIDLNNIGTILQAQGDLAGALEYTQRALAIGEKVYGPEHPNVASVANNIGGILASPRGSGGGVRIHEAGAGDRREGPWARASQRGHPRQQHRNDSTRPRGFGRCTSPLGARFADFSKVPGR